MDVVLGGGRGGGEFCAEGEREGDDNDAAGGVGDVLFLEKSREGTA